MKLNKETRNALIIGDMLEASDGCRLEVTNKVEDGKKFVDEITG